MHDSVIIILEIHTPFYIIYITQFIHRPHEFTLFPYLTRETDYNMNK